MEIPMSRAAPATEPASPPHPQPQPDRLLKISEVASRLGVCKRTVQRLVKDGRLPRVILRSTHAARYRESDVRRLIAGEAQAASAPASAQTPGAKGGAQ
jgi:excisionase family DNA binding protein